MNKGKWVQNKGRVQQNASVESVTGKRKDEKKIKYDYDGERSERYKLFQIEPNNWRRHPILMEPLIVEVGIIIDFACSDVSACLSRKHGS